MTRRRLTAWLVHLYTASGGVIGMFALLHAAQGNIRESFLLLCVTMLIDATDGMLARKVDVVEPVVHQAGVDAVDARAGAADAGEAQ